MSIPAAVTGIIVGVETKVQPAGEDKVVQVEYLNLLTDEGLPRHHWARSSGSR